MTYTVIRKVLLVEVEHNELHFQFMRLTSSTRNRFFVAAGDATTPTPFCMVTHAL